MNNLFLNSLINNESRPQDGIYSLKNIESILDSFDNPQNKIKFIHVAGTNGKGSVCMMLASIFNKSGLKTGLYTSPHLLEINERIQINCNNISDGLFEGYLDLIKEAVVEKNIHPSYFDVITAAAILYFADEDVDIAVMETGLGGRLDSTNVITPLCSIITDISPDHEYILGNTIAEITNEKCGIIKNNVPVVTTNQSQEITSIIQKKCIQMNSELFVFGRDFGSENEDFFSDKIKFDFYETWNNQQIKNIELNHPGNFQIKNSSAAAFVSLLLKINAASADKSIIAESIKNLEIRGRFEKISSNPFILFDPAHNIEAVKSLIDILLNKFRTNEIHMIFSLMSDKNIESITELISGNFKKIIYFRLNDNRAFSPDKTWTGKTGIKVISEKSLLSEYIACNKSDNAIFIFTGSFRLYETALEIAEKIKNE